MRWLSDSLSRRLLMMSCVLTRRNVLMETLAVRWRQANMAAAHSPRYCMPFILYVKHYLIQRCSVDLWNTVFCCRHFTNSIHNQRLLFRSWSVLKLTCWDDLLQTYKRLNACISATGGHFEHQMWTFFQEIVWLNSFSWFTLWNILVICLLPSFVYCQIVILCVLR